MTDHSLQSPDVWAAQEGIRILDADGWRFTYGDLQPKPYSEPITRDEFMQRMRASTVMGGEQ